MAPTVDLAVRRRQLAADQMESRQRRVKSAAVRRNMPPPPTWSTPDVQQGRDLPPDLLSEIHCRLDFVARLNFALGLGAVASRRVLNAEGSCLVLPGDDDDDTDESTATLFSLAGRQVAVARAPEPAMRRHVVVGSSGGWLVTADRRGRLRMANPVTGAQAALPDITAGTIPFFGNRFDFVLDMEAFSSVRFAGGRPDKADFWGGTFTHAGWQMRKRFYRKVVLSASPRPGNYAAMLILEQRFGAPAFVTSEDPAWRLAPSRDAVHHDGRFYSITYTGVVEAWDRHPRTRQYRSRALGPRLPGEGVHHLLHKYVAMAPDGRLMAVLKELKKVDKQGYYNSWEENREAAFKVFVLDEARGRWAEERDIGDAALFVGVNNSMCVSTKKCPGIRAGRVYYTDDELGQASLRLEKDEYDEVSSRSSIHGDRLADYNLRDLGVYSLQDGTVKRLGGLPKHKCWPPPAWFTPTV